QIEVRNSIHEARRKRVLRHRRISGFILRVDSFDGRKFEERSKESQDSSRGIGNSLEKAVV
ncbi:hypothetical protein, partial [Desulfosporosinus sp. I2]|uniref:hypothetical protein n=1 Tax=Desulfosporosinus sp. I2 TaxID=1617025 RepID=UPI001A9A63E8